MKKDKTGKIIASLTEVKNKTGDIFALVDQFGVVYLTSYNKIRYRIEKIGVENLIPLDSDMKDEQEISSHSKKNFANIANITDITDSFSPPLRVGVYKEMHRSKFDAEIEYISQIVKPLV